MATLTNTEMLQLQRMNIEFDSEMRSYGYDFENIAIKASKLHIGLFCTQYHPPRNGDPDEYFQIDMINFNDEDIDEGEHDNVLDARRWLIFMLHRADYKANGGYDREFDEARTKRKEAIEADYRRIKVEDEVARVEQAKLEED